MVIEITKHTGPAPQLHRPAPLSPVAVNRTDATSGLVKAQDSGVVAPPTAPEPAKPVDRAEAEKLAQGLEQLVQGVRRQLSFEVDKDTGETVIQVIDRETRKVLRQIPPETMLALQKRLAESQETGMNVDELSVEGVLVNSRV